jgi:hypothetical protein
MTDPAGQRQISSQIVHSMRGCDFQAAISTRGAAETCIG